METMHLRYSDYTGIVYLRDADGESIPLGSIEDADLDCPEEYLGELEWLRGEVEDARRYGGACEATAHAAYYGGHSPERW